MEAVESDNRSEDQRGKNQQQTMGNNLLITSD